MLLWMIGFGLAAAWSAGRLGRIPALWFVFGAILGPIALILLRAAPPALCRTCGSQTRGWLSVCWWCRQSVFGTLAETDRIDVSTRPRAIVRGSQAPASARVARAEAAREASALPLRDRLESPLGLERPRAEPLPEAEQLRDPQPARALRAEPHQDAEPSRREPGPKSMNLAGATSDGGSGSIRTRKAPRSTAVAATGSAVRQPLSTAESPRTTVARDRSNEPPNPLARLGHETTAVPARESRRILATAVYVAGSTNLTPGHRYAIAIHEVKLRILGPTEVEPQRVALDHPLAGLEARSVEGRLILADAHGLLLAFMAVAGQSPRDLAAAITAAARQGDPD